MEVECDAYVDYAPDNTAVVAVLRGEASRCAY